MILLTPCGEYVENYHDQVMTTFFQTLCFYRLPPIYRCIICDADSIVKWIKNNGIEQAALNIFGMKVHAYPVETKFRISCKPINLSGRYFSIYLLSDGALCLYF